MLGSVGSARPLLVVLTSPLALLVSVLLTLEAEVCVSTSAVACIIEAGILYIPVQKNSTKGTIKIFSETSYRLL